MERLLYKMGDTVLKCPLCCSKTFDSKPALIEHLTKTNDNIICPICQMKWSSVWHLIEHLSDDNCQLDAHDAAMNSNVDNKTSQTFVQNLEEADIKILQHKQCLPEDFEKDPLADSYPNMKSTVNGDLEMGPMYVELLSKQTTKPCLQTQELKLVKDSGGSRYVIMTDQNFQNALDAESTIVTKQNSDGTISLTTVRDMKMEPDTVITSENLEAEKAEEIYSCNTCGVSFTSVLEHIQNYHNDQDVVVEEPMDEESHGRTVSLEFNEPLETIEDTGGDKQVSRRMITETGDIIEAPIEKTSSLAPDESQLEETHVKQEMIDKKIRGRKKRYMLVDKFCDSVIMDIKEPEEKDKNGPYHKVVIKEVDTTNGEKVKVFNCISCSIYASSLEQFKSHPCKVLRYSCPHCLVSYENSKSLCAHMKVHKNKSPTTVTGTAPTSFVCEFCSTVFVTNKSLKLHKRMHDPVKVRPIEPPVEGAEGGEASPMKYLCSVCNKMIPIDYRTIHQNSHKGLDKYNCDICNKKFTSGEYLDMHMTVHQAEKVPVNKQDKCLPYTCLYCDRRFARPHEKVKHERIHTGEKPHACEICGKSFRVSYCLTLHMRTHTGARPYSCPHCGKRFKAHSVYNHHLLTHSEVRAYKCPYCPKAFKTSVQLAGHKNSHTKPFSCQLCNRPFASLYAVRVHTETHARQNNLKYSCSLCGASYARAFALNDHVKQAHGNDRDNDDHDNDHEEAPQTTDKEGESDWTLQPTSDAEDLPVSKKFSHEVEINELGISNSTELIVPS